jgi:serine/threonine protein kinase
MKALPSICFREFFRHPLVLNLPFLYDIFSMTLNSRLTELTETLSRLESEYQSLLEAFSLSLDRHWEVLERQTGNVSWRYFRSELKLPKQGWKIHVSSTATEAIRLIEKVLPYLVDSHASFKLPSSLKNFVYLNSGQGGSTQVGKTLTVYPVDDIMCRDLCLGIDERWYSNSAPVVPFDLSLGSCSSVYIRYGAIAGQYAVIDAHGQYTPAIHKPDGILVADRRDDPSGMLTWASAPPLECVFSGQQLQSKFQVGSNIYFSLRLIHSGIKGSVFLGVCGLTASSVIIKIGYRGVYSDLLGLDAMDRLRNEFGILTKLNDSGKKGLIPAPIGLEIGDDFAVLVLEDISGIPLHHLHRLSWNAQVDGIVSLMKAVATLHTLGFVHRDIKLANAVIADDGRAYLIDFELACRLGESRPILGQTRSYNPPENKWLSPPESTTDCYALGISLVHIILGCDPAELPLGRGRLIGLLHLIGACDYIELVSNLTDPIPSNRPTADVAAKTLKDIGAKNFQPAPITPKRIQANRRWLIRAASEAAKRSTEFLVQDGELLAWRNEHLFSHYCCEGINLGAAGIILGLATIAVSLGHNSFTSNIGSSVRWLASRDSFHEAHGLFTGNAGVALAMCVGAGFTPDRDLIRAKALKRLKIASQQVTEVDLFHGSAGIVLAGCLIAEVIGDYSSLEIVRPLADRLIRSPKQIGDLIIWEKIGGTDKAEDFSVGVSHGSAGIALALARWSHLTSDLPASTLAKEVFLGLYQAARTVDQKTLRSQINDSSSPAPHGNWCHGPAGYLWSMLYAFGDDSQLSQPIDWAVNVFDGASLIHNPTICHGLAGQLELCRMLKAIPRHYALADRRAEKVTAALRLLQQRREGLIAWSSENPDVFTPDLWVGFLGTAAVLSMSIVSGNDALLSGHWLRQCSEFASFS